MDVAEISQMFFGGISIFRIYWFRGLRLCSIYENPLWIPHFN